MGWTPLPGDGIQQMIADARERMTSRQRRLWDIIRIDPAKWYQSPYGDDGGGFWAVGLIGCIVVWYNDIEDGFQRTRYTSYGLILEYACDQLELEHVVEQLLRLIETDQAIGGPPKPAS